MDHYYRPLIFFNIQLSFDNEVRLQPFPPLELHITSLWNANRITLHYNILLYYRYLVSSLTFIIHYNSFDVQMFPLVREAQWLPGVLEGHGVPGSQARQRYQEHPMVERQIVHRSISITYQSIITLKWSCVIVEGNTKHSINTVTLRSEKKK
jgi:hypothetical protein